MERTGPLWAQERSFGAIVKRLVSGCEQSFEPLAIALPEFDVDLVISTQSPVESLSLGPVQKMGKAVDLNVVASAWQGMQLPFENCQPRSIVCL